MKALLRALKLNANEPYGMYILPTCPAVAGEAKNTLPVISKAFIHYYKLKERHNPRRVQGAQSEHENFHECMQTIQYII